MVDHRFHRSKGAMPLRTILDAALVPFVMEDERGEGWAAEGAAELAWAQPGHVALAAQKSYLAELRATGAGLVVVSPELAEEVPSTAIRLVSDRAHDLFVHVLEQLYPAVLPELADQREPPFLEDGVVLGPNVHLDGGVEIGAGTVIGANSVIGPGVAIGRNCRIAPNVSVEYAYIGSDVVLHAGARIGTEGFGWLGHGQSNRKIPQLGRVIIQDRVEIGANSTVDRGALGDTVIGEGTKIDNLVQVGHNCRIGRFCLIAAQSGLSGSTVLEDGVLFGGGAGTGGHLTIGQGSIVYGRAGVSKSWPAGSKLFGAPARDVKEYWREAATLRRLTEGRLK